MSVKYEFLKKLVVALGLKKRWLSSTTEELLENRRKQNAKNRIPALKDESFDISRIDVMGFPVLKLINKEHTNRANLFLIGGGMISAPRPASVKKALRFAKETGLDLFIPYYPLCTDYPLTKAYEMIHESYKVMLRDYAPGHISILGTSSGGNLALGMVPYINDGHGDTPMPGHIMAISPGTCADTEEEWQRMVELEKKDVAMLTGPMRWFCRMGGKRKFSEQDIRGMKATAALNAADRNPYSWNMEFLPYADGSGYEARFSKCGICTLMKELGLYDLVPAMCHLDYTMAEAGGACDFVREYTLASGGPYCDCGYKKKAAR